MFRHLHLTKLQWLGILKWSLYGLLTLVVLLLQTVVLSVTPVGFPLLLRLIPIP